MLSVSSLSLLKLGFGAFVVVFLCFAKIYPRSGLTPYGVLALDRLKYVKKKKADRYHYR